jgi:hypothetical protein
MNTDHVLDDKSGELQTEIDRLSEKLGVRPMPVGFRTNDGLNIYVGDGGSYHFTFYERGKLGFDRVGSLDDLLYWYCEGIVTREAAKLVGDRAERFKYEYQVLSQFDVDWAKRRVRELATIFRNGQPEDISLLPDIGEALWRWLARRVRAGHSAGGNAAFVQNSEDGRGGNATEVVGDPSKWVAFLVKISDFSSLLFGEAFTTRRHASAFGIAR